MIIDILKSNLTTGRLSRREFIQSAIAVGLTLPAALTIVSDVEAAIPKKGGKLRYGVGSGSTSDSLDPGLAGDPISIPLVFGYCNHLTEIDNTGKLVPELAESWETSSDAKIWTFAIRQGVEFHNGQTLKAEDVVASYNHHRGEQSTSKAKSIADLITSIKADGNNRVVIELNEGNADFAYIVSDYHFGILPSKDGQIDAVAGIGTGPYSVVSFKPGISMTFKRNPNYFKADRAHFDEIVMLALNDTTSRANALISGEIDVMDRVELKTAHLMQRNPNLDLEETTGTQHYTLPMNCETAPFDNVDVRLALKYAIDRDSLVETILFGHGKVGNDHPIAPANRYYAADLEQRTYDPEKAKFHLKQAGMESLPVELHAAEAAFNGAVDTAVLFKEQANKAGINIDIKRVPNDGYWDDVWMKKPWVMSYWGGRPTEDWMFTSAYSSTANWNEAFWKNTEFDQLLSAARVELDDTKRGEMYGEMQRLVKDDGGSIIPMFANYLWAKSNKVMHDENVASNYDVDGEKLFERWWFA